MTDRLQPTLQLSPEAKRAMLADLLARKGRESLGPLSRGQRSLWFMHQLAPESIAYNVQVAWRIRGELEAGSMLKALEMLADRHPALRTTYKVVDGTPVQMMHQRLPWSWSADEGPMPEGAVRLAVDALARQPFDLERGPVVRAALFHQSSSDHVLALAFHHIAYDDWSGQVLARELPALYEAARRGAAPSLAPLAATFADFVRHENELLEGPSGERLWNYWKERLGGELPALNLPTIRPRPAVQTFDGRSFSFAITDDLTQRIQQLARERSTTPYVVVLTAFEVLLHRLSGQDDVLVGTPTNGRSRPDFSEIAGYFVNPVVLRADLSGDPTFVAAAERLQDVVLGAIEHAEFPFALLVERLQPERDIARSPLFQVSFVWDRLLNPERTASDSSLLTLEPFAGGQPGATFDLGVTMFHDGRSLSGSWKYNLELFDAETVKRFHGYFLKLLEGAVEDPARRISEIPMLPADERRQLLVDWNDTAADRSCSLVHQLVEAQTARTPDAPAVFFGQASLSYRELNAQANRLARALQSRGVGPDVLVGVALERSLRAIVSLLAVLKAGGAYVPFDPDYPADRLSFMIADSKAALILTENRVGSRMDFGSTPLLAVDAIEAALTQESDDNLGCAVSPDNLAYVIYTSGSTGRPKGAMNTHRAIANRLLWMQEAHALDGHDRMLQKTPYSFDVSVWEIFWPLLAGASVTVAAPGAHRNPDDLVTAVNAHGVTTMHFVPSMLQLFLQAADVEKCHTLERVFSGGEALTAATRNAFRRRSTAVLYNQYGPAETAADVSSWRCEDEGTRPVPIGRPGANTALHVLDRHLEPVPAGVEGDLYVGGVQVGRGYLHRPSLTADRFVPDPCSATPGARLYRSGDRARRRPDGAIEFLGRADDQVKVRGCRIELGEIETVLAGCPGVGAAAVTVRGDNGDERLVAYITPGSGKPTVEQLRAHCAGVLPDYMVPAAFAFLDAMPLAPSGKLLRRALPAFDVQRALENDMVAPRDETERQIAAIWTAVLGIDRVGVHDDFFHLGGHSMLVTKVVSRMSQAFGVDLRLRTFFERPTIEGLALAIVEEQARHVDDDTLARLLADVEQM